MSEPTEPSVPICPPQSLRLALRFAKGHGRLVAAPWAQTGCNLTRLVLELPDLRFPCDVSGGVNSFRDHASELFEVALSLTAADLTHWLNQADLLAQGIASARVDVHDGYIVFVGTLKAQEGHEETPFALQAAFFVDHHRPLTVLLYGLQMFGPGFEPGVLLAERLRLALAQCLPEGCLQSVDASAWSLSLGQLIGQTLLPAQGFRAPDASKASLTHLAVTPSGIHIGLSAANTSAATHTAVPKVAQDAYEASRYFARAEQALVHGEWRAAARHYETAAFNPDVNAAPKLPTHIVWAKERAYLLALGDDALTDLPLDWQHATGSVPLKLLAAAYQSTRNQPVHAAEAYEACLGDVTDDATLGLTLLAAARERRRQADGTGGARAVTHLQHALACTPLPAYAQAWLCQLLWARKDVPQALAAARAWVEQLQDKGPNTLGALGDASCTAAALCLAHGDLIDEAQGYLERFLARVPKDPAALWQLLRVHAAACNIGGAKEILGHLVHTAQSEEDDAQCAQQLVALGDLWQEAMHDGHGAQRLYHTALERAPAYGRAHLHLADQAFAHNDGPTMVAHLSQLIAGDTTDPAACGHLSQEERADAYLRLGTYQMQTGPYDSTPRDLPSGLVHLRCALDLSPERDDVRMRLEDALRAAKDWAALAELLVSTGAQAAERGDLPRARRWQLQAARLHLGERAEPQEALGPLLALVRRCPDDEEALTLLVPLLEAQNDTATLRRILDDAAHSEQLPALHRGHWMACLWHLERQMGAPAATQLPILRTLLAIFPQHLEAACAQVALLENDTTIAPEATNAHDHVLAQAYTTWAEAAVMASERAQAWRMAARTLSYLGKPVEALRALEASAEAAPLDVDTWLLGAQLKHDVHGAQAARVWLSQAVAEDEKSATLPWGYRLYDRLAELASAAGDICAEVDALTVTVSRGGASYKVCMRLLAALERQGRHLERAEWLMRWAEAGWPLDIAASYQRAAAIYLDQASFDGARRAYRAMAQLDAQAMHQAGEALVQLGEQENTFEDIADGYAILLRAAEQTQDTRATARHKDALLLAYEAANKSEEAQALCQQMLVDHPKSALPHALMAVSLVGRRCWASALDHALQATLYQPQETLPAKRAEQIWRIAHGLAQDLRPELEASLDAAWATRCSQFGPGQKALAYSERLLAQGDFATAQHLLEHMLDVTDCAFTQGAIRLRLARLLVDHEGDVDAAEILLRTNLAQDSTDVASRRTLVSVYARKHATAQQAELHLALSNLVPDPAEALEHTLASAELYAQDPTQRTVAEQIVMAYANRDDVPKVFPALWEGLRRLGMLGQLARILADGLTQSPSAEDGRLAQLVRLLAHELQQKAGAISWCSKMQQAFPHVDAPWHLHLELLMPTGTAPGVQIMAEAEAIYLAWSKHRQGEAQAVILDALAQHLRGAGEATGALRALEAALDVSDAGPVRAQERLMVLTERYLARNDVERAVSTLDRLLAVLPQGETADAQLRRLAELSEAHLQDSQRAMQALRKLQKVTANDAQTLARLAQEHHAYILYDEVPEVMAFVTLPQLWAAGQALCVDRKLPAARVVLTQVLDRLLEPAAPQDAEPSIERVWALAQEIWHETGCERALCAWRLTWAQSAPAPWATWSQLLALVALHEGSSIKNTEDALDEGDEALLAEGMGRSLALCTLDAVDLNEAMHLPHAFTLARLLHVPAVAARVGEAWLKILPAQDQRRLLPLQVCAEAALQAKQPSVALAYGQELEALGDDTAEALLLQALALQGDKEALLVRLRARVDVAQGEPAKEHVLALAQELLRQRDGVGAKKALEQVGLLARDFAWAQLAVPIYALVEDASAQAEAAALCSHLAHTAKDRGYWLRIEAQVRWWSLDDPQGARQKLLQAQSQSPMTYAQLEATLADATPFDAQRRLQEALVVMPADLSATLYRRLASLTPHGPQRNDALAQALATVGDDVHELGLLAEAARAAGAQTVLHGALRRQARLAQSNTPRRAAKLLLEAAHGLPEHEAALLWIEAAEVLFALGDNSEAVGLVHRALAAGTTSLALYLLVWRHLPHDAEARGRAAWALAQAKMNHATSVPPLPDSARLYLAAAQAALAQDAAQACATFAALAEHEALQLTDEGDKLAVLKPAFLVHEAALQHLGDIAALVSLWWRAVELLGPQDPIAITRRRRTAYFSVALAPQKTTEQVWQALHAAEPGLAEARIQVWGLRLSGGDVHGQLSAMAQGLEPLAFDAERVHLVLSGALVLDRHCANSEAAITFLGGQLRAAMAAWMTEQETLLSDPNALPQGWLTVAALGDALAARLSAAGSEGDRLAVLAHCARLAPPQESLARLAHAGRLAQAAGDHALAYTLLYPVAVAAPGQNVTPQDTEVALQHCLKIAQEARDHDVIIAMYTRLAQRSVPAKAAAYFAEAATWAQEASLSSDQGLRLLQAAYALRPEPEVASRLIAGLLARGDVAALLAAQPIFVGATLPDETVQKLGLMLIAALEAARGRDDERAQSILAAWEALSAQLPQLPEARGFRLRRARMGQDPEALLAALQDCLADPEANPNADTWAGMHGEAAQLAQQLGRWAQAWEHWQQALTTQEPPPVALWQAYQGSEQATAAGEVELGTLWGEWVLAQVALHQAGLRAVGHAPTARLEARQACLRMLCRQAAADGAIASHKEALVALWGLLRHAETRPQRAEAHAVGAQLAEVLERDHAWEALAVHLSEQSASSHDREACGRYLWHRGDILRERLGRPRDAKQAYAAAIEALPDAMPLRILAAQTALELGEPVAAEGYLALGADELPHGVQEPRLALLLRAMVAQETLLDAAPIVEALLRRDPQHLDALQAQARLCAQRARQEASPTRLAAAEAAYLALAQAQSSKDAQPAERASTLLGDRGDALETAAQFATDQGAFDRACQALRSAIQYDPSAKVRARRMQALTEACLAAHYYEEAALLLEAQAEATDDRAHALACWVSAARLWQVHCDRHEAAVRALWRATATDPDAIEAWLQLEALLPADGPPSERLAVAERLTTLAPPDLQDAALLTRLALVYVDSDPHRAQTLFARAESQGGVTPSARSTWEEVAWQCGDMQTYLPLGRAAEAADVAAQDAPGAKGRRKKQLMRRARLAEGFLGAGNDRTQGLRYLKAAISLLPHPSTPEDMPAIRHVASLCATEPRYQDIALKLYGIVLEHDPLDVEALRIAARLAGQAKNIDWAYGLYACLLWLFPEDAEARAFVQACRAHGPVRAASATRGPWVKRVQQALDSMAAQGALGASGRPQRDFDVAQLVRRDIEIVLCSMLPLPPAQAARGRALARSPEALALFRFAQSPQAVILRRQLGADLATTAAPAEDERSSIG